ncbi:MAG: 6-hydroxymethylpterin diphosphokinase MptE-like protein [Bacteroidota bacterium]
MESLPAYQELFQDEIVGFQNALRESVRIARLNLATSNLFGEQWLVNAIKNLKYITDSPGVRNYFNQFKGVPGIIVSAGPSLEKNVRLLNKIKEKAVIICAGTSIRAMQKMGVKPHFLVAFDGTHYNATIYRDLDLEDISLIYNYRFNYQALSYFKEKKIYMKLDSETFSDFLSYHFNGYDFGTIRSGFSVAHPSLDLAVQFGCDPIILIGQDLAYTDDKRYAESQNQQYIQRDRLPDGCFITKDINSQDIVTDRQLDSFRLLFELMVEHYYKGKANIFNATEGGQPIKGIPNRKLQDVIDQYCLEEHGISYKIEQSYQKAIKELKLNKISNVDLIKKFQNQIKQGISIMEGFAERLQQLRRLNYIEQFDFDRLEPVLNHISVEYRNFIKKREWELLLKDLQEWKIAAIQINIAEIETRKNKEDYDLKLQYWMNIIFETKNYLERIIEYSQDASLETATEKENGDSIGKEEPSTSVKVIETPERLQIESFIRQGDLKKAEESVLKILGRKGTDDISYCQYLYGWILFKRKQFTKAIPVLEQALDGIECPIQTNLLLFKIYYQNRNFIKAKDHLMKCYNRDFKIAYCRKMLAKVAYISKDFIAANNYIMEYREQLKPYRYWTGLRVDCLQTLGLNHEANNEFQKIVNISKTIKKFVRWLEQLLKRQEKTEFETNYCANEVFFKKRGIDCGNFETIRYKACQFLGENYIFDNLSGKVLLAVEDSEHHDLQISGGDTLLICNTDNLTIYQSLQEIAQKAITNREQKDLLNIPVFILEEQLENWQLLMEKFNFNSLSAFQNLHFIIAPPPGEMERIFVNPSAPLPNILYGTGLEQIKKILEGIRQKKEDLYQTSLDSLKQFYNNSNIKTPRRILIVTSIANELLFQYGQMLHSHFSGQGYDCQLFHETLPYYKFTKYADLDELERFRPDLVIHLFALQNELEVFGKLNIPFISWQLLNKPHFSNLKATGGFEKVLVSGDIFLYRQLLQCGFKPEQLCLIPLPYDPAILTKGNSTLPSKEITVIADLKNIETVIDNIVTVVFGVLAQLNRISRQEINEIIRSVYFSIYSSLLNETNLGEHFYEQIIDGIFKKRNFTIESNTIHFIAELFRRELEDSMLKTIHTKWITNEKGNYRLRIYGEGWENEGGLRQFYQGRINIFGDEFREVILSSKINLFIGGHINNNSYIQPELINGIALGGFFLVNGNLALKIGESVLAPFNGLLELYQTHDELVEKVVFFLTNEEERIRRAKRLQEYVLEAFSIEKVVKKIIS